MVAGEGGVQYINMDHISRRIITSLQDLSGDQNDTSKDRLYAAWRQLVQEASEAGLTYESDRLYTIAGLSHLLQRTLQTQYVCGTWTDDLALEIYWAPQARNRTLFTCKRPSVLRAPSWCWSSLEGPIRFRRANMKACTARFETVNSSLPIVVVDTPSNHPMRGLEPSWALHLLAHVTICEVTMNGILWRGSEDPQLVSPESEDFDQAAKGSGLLTFDKAEQLLGGSWFDLQPTKLSFGHYTCMLLLECTTTYDSTRRRYGVGLLLTTNMGPSDAHQTYPISWCKWYIFLQLRDWSEKHICD